MSLEITSVLLAYNEPVLPPTHPEADSERDVLELADATAARLNVRGFRVSAFGVGRDLQQFQRTLRAQRPDVVFNMFEGLGDDPESECRFAELLATESVPFTGCSSSALWQAGRKDVAKRLFEEAGLSTPRYFVVERLPSAGCQLKWPVIVKPAFRDASVGIDGHCVVTTQVALEQRVAQIAAQYGFPILVEEFIEGREISAAVIDWPEVRMLMPVETLFVGRNGDWPIVSYDAKWRPDSHDYDATPLRYPAELPAAVGERLARAAEAAFRIVGCRDFATVDFRLAADGTPYLLELNPNPGLAPSPCLVKWLELAGVGYDDFLVHMVRSAMSRGDRATKVESSVTSEIQNPAVSTDPASRSAIPHALPILNLAEARYECTYGRGCDGVCCSEGRPPVYPEEVARLDANLEKFLPLLRAEARSAIRRRGYLSRRTQGGKPKLRTAGGWCVFFNAGCVLHKVGAEEGDKFRYKPSICALFPIQADKHGNWYVRQKGYKGEIWDLFCLDPAQTTQPAAESLKEELALARRFEDEYQSAAAASSGGQPNAEKQPD
jgi:D-alanine-D-alanine ligase